MFFPTILAVGKALIYCSEIIRTTLFFLILVDYVSFKNNAEGVNERTRDYYGVPSFYWSHI